MKIRNTFVSLATTVLVLAGGLPSTAVAAHTYQTSGLFAFSTGAPVRGAATLTRSADAVWGQISTKNLHGNNAYTVWVIVWNDPSQCLGGVCGDEEGDFGVPGNSTFWGAGFVTGSERTVNLSFHVDAGDLAEGIDVLDGAGLEVGMGYDAEIHIVVRSHGGVIRGMADVQISRFDGACSINTCFDSLFAVFLPNPPAAP